MLKPKLLKRWYSPRASYSSIGASYYSKEDNNVHLDVDVPREERSQSISEGINPSNASGCQQSNYQSRKKPKSKRMSDAKSRNSLFSSSKSLNVEGVSKSGETSELSKLLKTHYYPTNPSPTPHKQKESAERKKKKSEDIKQRVSHIAADRAKRLVIETNAMAFYACITVLSLFLIMIFCISLSIVDLERYNFALYYTLLCLVGIMLACAFCIAHPKACPNPVWYNRCCEQVMELYPDQNEDQNDPSSVTAQTQSQLPHLRATAFMLSPAMHLMQSMWKGMAWIAEGIEEEETMTHDTESNYHGHTHVELGSTILDLTSTLFGESSSPSSQHLPVIEEIVTPSNSQIFTV